MIRILPALLLAFVLSPALAQDPFEWSADDDLTLGDFTSPATEINSSLTTYSVYSGQRIEFSFNMTRGEFMFTKNFNSKVQNRFYPEASVITAPDSAMAKQLVNFAQYSFDLSELYARRFRKELYEQKGAFSNTSYYQPIYDNLQKEMNAEIVRVQKITDLGRKTDLLEAERGEVRKAIAELEDFCFTCKPPKKKKS